MKRLDRSARARTLGGEVPTKSALGLVAVLVTACGPAPTATPDDGTAPPPAADGVPPRQSDDAQIAPIDLPTRSGFGRLGVGEPARLEPPRFVQEGGKGSYRLTGETARIGGVELPDTYFHLGGDGRLAKVELAASAADTAEIGRLRELAFEVCVGLGAELEVHVPSPLGTPEPGEEWDPVITETGTCDRETNGVRVRVRSEHNSASDFARLDLAVTVTPGS